MEVILLVSPDSKTRLAISALLDQEYKLVLSDKGEQALEIIRQKIASAVLVDFHVGDMPGIELFKKIHNMDKGVPVFMLGLQAESVHGQDALAHGVYDLLSEPFEGARLRLSLQRGLETNRLLGVLKKTKGVSLEWDNHYLPAEGVQEGLNKENLFLPRAPLQVEVSQSERHFYREIIQKFSKVIVNVLDVNELMQLAVRAIGEIFRVNRIALLIAGAKWDTFKVGFSTGFDESFLNQFTFSLHSGLCHWLLNNNCVLIRQELEHRIDHNSSALIMELNLLKVSLAFPLFSKGKLIGALTMANKILGQSYKQEELEILSLMTDYLAVSIANALLYNDISYQKSLKESILSNIGSGIIASDLDGNVTLINKMAENLLKLSSNEILGKSIQRVGSLYADIIFRTLEQGIFFTKRRIVDAATKTPIAISTSLIRDAQNAVIGVMMVLNDLTEEEEKEKEIKYLQQMEFWGQIATRLSQEMNNPLATIKTFFQLLPEKFGEGDEDFSERFYEVVRQDIVHFEEIIKKIINFPQQLPNFSTALSIHDLLDSALSDFQKSKPAGDIKILTRFSSEKFSVKSDAYQMEEVFLNILDNCLDALNGQDKAKIIVSTRLLRVPLSQRFNPEIVNKEPLKRLEISFQDNGSGIPDNNLENIFSPFFTTKIKGLGLGLTIAKRIVENHKGEILAESNEGKGSVVKIILPTID